MGWWPPGFSSATSRCRPHRIQGSMPEWRNLNLPGGTSFGRDEDRQVKRLTCEEVLDQLSEYLDDEARVELVQAVDHHLGACVHCQAEVDTLRRTIEIYRC